MSDGLLVTPLRDAAASLERALAQPKDEFMRDATIQRFEYSFELAWKLLQRRLVDDEGREVVMPLSRRELFRLAATRQLIEDPAQWFAFHRARNMTSHTYNEAVAEEVYEIARSFLPAMQALIEKLERPDG